MLTTLTENLTAAQFQQAVLAWYEKHGRKHLPWQQEINAYKVWLSEIMLQQTQVATVIPYFQRFIAAFPNVESLAEASTDEVMHLWTGLGYYSRARNLHKTAQIISEQYQGIFPQTVAELAALPGIGPSTAAAIISLAFEKRGTILDGNVKRVLSRYAAIAGWPGEKAVEKQLWQIAEKYTPHTDNRAYTQVMMDIGATLCTRTQPKCSTCPLQASCQAYQLGRALDFPGKKPKKTLPVRQAYLLLLQQENGYLLLEKRPPSGIWGGLWCLPEYKEELTQLTQWCMKYYGLAISSFASLPSFRHTFSHFHYDITPIQASVSISTEQIREGLEQRWYDPKQAQKIGFAQPIKKLLETV